MKTKRLILLLLVAVIMLISLSSCQMSHERVLDTLPDYFASFEYLDPNSFRDYTYYCKYYYKNLTSEALNESKYFSIAGASDVEEILLFIENYEMHVSASPEASRVYDFDKSVIGAGDYFYIETIEGKKSGEITYGKFDDYDVYYFDLESQILYYFHNND